MINLNTKSYWNNRFSSGDWEQKKGRLQTRQFAISQIQYLKISKDFRGTILDFGCGLGDAIPIYKKRFPNAKLIGIDISEEAIKKCKATYGHLAEFNCGTFTDVPNVDIIIASNVFEHLSDDKIIASHLLKKCKQLNIIVPYNELIFPNSEHINSYKENYFCELGANEYQIFISKGWSQYKFTLLYHVYFKNIFRPFLGKLKVKRSKQIIFTFFNNYGTK